MRRDAVTYLYLAACVFAVACGGQNQGAELDRSEGIEPSANGLVCFGDPDTGAVCVPVDMWDCSSLHNGQFKCARADFGLPSGGISWDCVHGEFTVTCRADAPDAVGGAGWNCEQQEGERICVSESSPNGPSAAGGTVGGSSGSTNDGEPSGGTDFPGSGPITIDGAPAGDGLPASGGGNWVCKSDEFQTVCSSTHVTNVPPGGTTWDCALSPEFGLVCSGDDAPSIPLNDGSPTGDVSGDTTGSGSGSDGTGSGGSTTPPVAEGSSCYCAVKTGKTTLVGQQVATVVTRSEQHGGKAAVYAQLTLSKDFTDNTYGANSSPCWSASKKGTHQFKELVGSDAAEMNFYDCDGNHVLGTQIDYLSEAGTASGYDSLCVSGGDGQMTKGSRDAVLGCQTALDVNLNTHGYQLTEDSPPWDNYNPTAPYPNWIYEVWYGVWVDAAVFGDAGLCKVTIDYVHSSPACGGSNSVDVEPCPC